MAESAVSFLLDKLGILLKDEVRLLKGVRTEIEFIRDELQRMKAFLRHADAREETDEEIKVWVKQVRDVAYDTEDIVDEFMLRLGHDHDHGQGFRASFRKASYSIKNLKFRRWIATELQGIKSRVTNIFEGHQRYCNGLNILEQGSSSSARSNHTDYESRWDALLLEEAELVGIEKPKKQLIRWLVYGDSTLKVVSVLGMGGLGKTTLVKKVYDEAKVKKHFQNHAWINVSQSFKLEALLKDMIQQLFSEIKQPIPPGLETMDSYRLKATINEFLRERRYILVLDDVWRISDWDAFRHAFPESNCGSRVLLTTRIGEVASRSSQEYNGNVFELMPLSQEESWTLFCKKTFSQNLCPPHLEQLSKNVLQRCEGLPLAIVAISGVLVTKDKNRTDEWEMVRRNLSVELEGEDRFKSMKKILSLSYDDLPYYLKSCFLYMSIFPEDHLIECMRLIRLWIAEGFVEEKEGKMLEEVAEGYLNQLFSRSLIQVAGTTTDGRVKLCRIHDLLREIILSRCKDQNFIATINKRNERWPEKTRHVSVYQTLGNVEQNQNLHQLRSLHIFGEGNYLSNSSVQSLFTGGLRLLKVLDFSDTPFDVFPNEITKLSHLRYLSLRNTKVKSIPSSIGKLQNLETLDLKGANVTELPVEILNLQQLRHLLVYRYKEGLHRSFGNVRGFNAPSRIGRLLSLQKLNYIEANQESGKLMEEIGRLIHLRRLGILKLRKEDGKALCCSIEKLTNLRSLNVSSFVEDEIIDMQHLSSPPQFLRTLCLEGHLEKLPCWIPALHSLARVHLRSSQLKGDPLDYLGSLPNLVVLELDQAYDGETFWFKTGGFQKLKMLWLVKLKGLRLVRVEEGSMPNLEKLYISGCKLLERVPSGIQHLTNLNLFAFADMPYGFGMPMTLKQNQKSGDHWKIAHIPSVLSSFSKDGR